MKFISQFSKYCSIGILNTLIHWGVFFIAFSIVNEQSISNLIGFFVSVIFSFIMNSKYTFKQNATTGNFLSFALFMGGLSYIVGNVSDKFDLPKIFTLVFFSGISLVLGFLYSKFIVFKGKK